MLGRGNNQITLRKVVKIYNSFYREWKGIKGSIKSLQNYQ